MTLEEFEKLVEEAVLNIPERFRSLMDNVAVTVEEQARPEHGRAVGIRKGSILLGLYEGVPRTQRGPNYSMVPPDKITIFMEPIVAIGHTEEGIKKMVFETVWHEVAHHFGMDEERVRKAESKRKT